MDNFYAPMILHSVANPAIYKPGSSRKLIAASDIGAAAAEAFIHPEVWIGKQLDLAGDDLTPQEIVDMFQEVKGMDISGKQVGLPPFLRIMFDVSRSLQDSFDGLDDGLLMHRIHCGRIESNLRPMWKSVGDLCRD